MGIFKRGSFIFTVVVFIAMIVCFPASVAFADSDGDYYISDITISATVDDNGDMSVKEVHEYVFNDSFHGIKRDVITKGSDGISDVSVKVAKGSKTETPRSELNSINQGKEIKIYSASANETKKFYINYKLKNVITKFSDVARLKWIFYQNTQDVKTSRITVYLTLPQQVNSKVKYNGVGPERGLYSLDEKKRIKLELNDMGDNERIGAQVTFPRDWVNTSKTENMTAKAYDAMIRRQEMQGAAVVGGSIAVISGITAAAIYISGKKRRKAIEEYRSQYDFYSDKYYSQLPSTLPPEMVAVLLNKSIDINELMASILNLENKGAISFLESGFFDRDYDNLCFVINPDSPHHKLMRSERYLVDWLRYYSERNVVYLNFIQKNSSGADFSNRFNAWKSIVKEEAEELNFYTHILGKRILTNEYEDEKIKWMAFKAYLRDSGEEEVIQLKEKGLWDHILPYAMALDVASGIINHLEQYGSNSSLNNSNSIFMNYWFLNYYTGMYYGNIHRGYTTYVHNSNSSSSGNFSSGGSGFGGGGGGGAF